MPKCPNCGTELDENVKFCYECGTPIPQVKKCVKCGTELPLKMKFCFNCGAPQNGVAPATAGVSMGDKNVVAGDVIGQKIAGDNVGNKIMGNVINTTIHDESKKILSCSVCGKHLTNESAYTCPDCQKVVCRDHFDHMYRCCTLCSIAKAKNIIVDINGKGHFTSITEALEHAQEGAVIMVKSGTYREHFVIDKRIRLCGELGEDGYPLIWDDTTYINSVITITADAEVDNLRVQGALQKFDSNYEYSSRPSDKTIAEWYPKCIYVKSDCKLNGLNVAFSARYGIAVSGKDISPKISNCQLHDNAGMGVTILDGSNPVIECSLFYANVVGVNIRLSSAVSINNRSNFYENELDIRCDEKSKLNINKALFGLKFSDVENVDEKLLLKNLSDKQLEPAIEAEASEINISEAFFLNHSLFKNGVSLRVDASVFIVPPQNSENDVFDMLWFVGHNIKASIENCEFSSQNEKAEIRKNAGLYIVGDGEDQIPDVTISNTTFENIGVGVRGSNNNCSLNSCKFNHLVYVVRPFDDSMNITEQSCSTEDTEWTKTKKLDDENSTMKTNQLIVSSDGFGDFTSVSEALKNSVDGSTIIVKYGKYQEHLVIDKIVTIIGEANEKDEYPVIEGNVEDYDYCVEVRVPAALKNFVLTQKGFFDRLLEDDREPGVVAIFSDATIENCDIQEGSGDGIVIQGGNPTVLNCKIHNFAEEGVCVICGSQGNIEKCDIFENGHRGIFIRGEKTNPSINDCKIHDNKKQGMLIWGNARGVINKCDIYENETDGMDILDVGTNPVITGCRLHDNIKYGLYMGQGACGLIEKCVFFKNKFSGIDIFCASPKIENCKIYEELNGITVIGGNCSVRACEIFKAYVGVKVYASVSISECRVHNCGEYGIWIDKSAKPNIVNCVVCNNTKKDIKKQGLFF